MIESDGGARLLVDTGPDMRDAVAGRGVPRVDAILYTHAHADHIAGLDDVRILNRIVGRPLTPSRPRDPGRADSASPTHSGLEAAGFLPPGAAAPAGVPGETVEAAGMPAGVRQDHGVRTLGLRVGGFGYSTDVVA